MLIWSPVLRHPRRISGICSQVDVLPTLAGLCAMPYRNTTLGRDLLDTATYADKGLAFIYDPDQAYIGVIKGDYFYRRQLTTGKEEMVSVVGNDATTPATMAGPVKQQLQQLSDGIYEVSRYMLLMNKKAEAGRAPKSEGR